MLRILVADGGLTLTTGLVSSHSTSLNAVSTDLTYTYASRVQSTWNVSRVGWASNGLNIGAACLIGDGVPDADKMPTARLLGVDGAMVVSDFDRHTKRRLVPAFSVDTNVTTNTNRASSSHVTQAPAGGGGSIVVNVAIGHVYEYPCVANGSFTPAAFNVSTTYHNNISEKGLFIGRSVVRKSSSVSIQPLSFRASAERMGEVLDMFDSMRKHAVYVHHEVGGENFVYYGWTDNDPSFQYIGEGREVEISFNLRCPA